jgi:hypothetical protein
VTAATQRERDRQQQLLSVLWRRQDVHALQPWLQGADWPRAGLGVDAYLRNAGASAERALAAVFPTVRQLIGEEAFAAMSRAYWHAQPPQRGDLAQLGAGLPAFIAGDTQLADVPYLADVARLELALSDAESAADVVPELDSLQQLAGADPASIRLVLQPGTSVVASRYPIAAIHAAHRAGTDEAFDAARQAVSEARSETAFVWREGWQAHCVAIDEATARWTRAVLDRATLGTALRHAGTDFDFAAWLAQAIRQRWLQAAQPVGTSP